MYGPMTDRISWYAFWAASAYVYWALALLCIIGTLTDHMHLGWTGGFFLALMAGSIYFAYLDTDPVLD
jgi:hypothetical protein